MHNGCIQVRCRRCNNNRVHECEYYGYGYEGGPVEETSGVRAACIDIDIEDGWVIAVVYVQCANENGTIQYV